MAARPDRFEFADDMFMRRHRGAGAPVVNQFAWRLPGAYDPDAVREFGAALSLGALHRRATRATLPFARGRWAPSPAPAAIELHEDPIGDDEIIDWMTRDAAAGIDPAAGTAWRLAAVPTDSGALVSLTAAHAAADGAALVDAIVRAAGQGEAVTPIPLPRGRALIADDLRDAAGQARAIRQWARDRRGAGPEPFRTPLTPVTDDPELPGTWVTPVAVAELATAELEALVEGG